MDTLGFDVRQGSVVGNRHTKKGINNQDAYSVDHVIIDGREHLYGVVADGCSVGGKKNLRGQTVRTEVGAVLLTAFVRSEIPLLLAAHTPIESFPEILYHRCVSYLANIARTTVVGGPEKQWDFIERHLLSTVVGFVMNEQVTVPFYSADGVIVVNNEVNIIDEQNVPSYLAYHLVDRSILGQAADKLPRSFSWALYPTAEVDRFAVCTDGIAGLWHEDPQSINGIWEYQPDASAGLQWWLNKRSNDSKFVDDCTIIAGRRVSEAKEDADAGGN